MDEDRQLDRERELTERYNQYLPLAFKMAKKARDQYGIPLAISVDLCKDFLANCIANWYNEKNPSAAHKPKEKGGCSEMTWVWRWLNWETIDYVRRGPGRRKMVKFSELGKTDDEPFDVPDRSRWFDRLLRNLSDDAKEIVGVIVNAPAEILVEIYNLPRKERDSSGKVTVPKVSSGKCASGRAAKAVREYLCRQGWDPARVETAWVEISEALYG